MSCRTKKEQEKVRGTVCAAMLDGDPNCPSLLAVSVYDTKPVHFLSMAAEKICWETKTREVFNRETGKMGEMKFHRLNVNDDYNYGMGGADIADQIRGSYRFDHWARKFKWWHSIFWWGVQVLMVNSYRCYRKHLEMNKLTPMSHYDYQKKIAHVWLNKDYYTTTSESDIVAPSTSRSASSAVSTVTTATTIRKARICESSLHPLTGALKCRLNTRFGHWPTAPSQSHPNQETVCQLHRWITGKRKYKDVQFCPDCNVSLCTEGCYQIFHTEWDLAEEKEALKRKL